MAPVAAAALVLIAAAIFVGFFAGALGGAIVWRLRWNIGWGGLLTLCTYVLIQLATHHWSLGWLYREIVWGGPSMSLGYLLSSVTARWLAGRTKLHPNWTTVIAFALAMVIGSLYMRQFRFHIWGPILAADVVSISILLFMRKRRLHSQ